MYFAGMIVLFLGLSSTIESAKTRLNHLKNGTAAQGNASLLDVSESSDDETRSMPIISPSEDNIPHTWLTRWTSNWPRRVSLRSASEAAEKKNKAQFTDNLGDLDESFEVIKHKDQDRSRMEMATTPTKMIMGRGEREVISPTRNGIKKKRKFSTPVRAIKPDDSKSVLRSNVINIRN